MVIGYIIVDKVRRRWVDIDVLGIFFPKDNPMLFPNEDVAQTAIEQFNRSGMDLTVVPASIPDM